MPEEVNLRISTEDRMVVPNLMESESGFSIGMTYSIDDSTEIEYSGNRIQKGVGGPEIHEFVLLFSAGVSSNVVGRYIWEKIKDSDIDSVVIGEEEVEADEQSIKDKIDEYVDD